jgi:hypothetical protein
MFKEEICIMRGEAMDNAWRSYGECVENSHPSNERKNAMGNTLYKELLDSQPPRYLK